MNLGMCYKLQQNGLNFYRNDRNFSSLRSFLRTSWTVIGFRSFHITLTWVRNFNYNTHRGRGKEIKWKLKWYIFHGVKYIYDNERIIFYNRYTNKKTVILSIYGIKSFPLIYKQIKAIILNSLRYYIDRQSV